MFDSFGTPRPRPGSLPPWPVNVLSCKTGGKHCWVQKHYCDRFDNSPALDTNLSMTPAKNNTVERVFSLLGSVFGNLFLGWLFLRALVWPEDHAQFIFRSGLMLYIAEFLSIHSSGMTQEPQGRNKNKGLGRISLLGLYGLFIFLCAYGLKSWFIAIHFWVSLLAKVFFKRSAARDMGHVPQAFATANLIASTFLVILLAPLLNSVCPIPPAVMEQRMPGSSGLFVDVPQTLLAWGVLYFTFTALFNIIAALNERILQKHIAELKSSSANLARDNDTNPKD